MQFTPSNSTYFHSLPDPHLKNTNRPLAPRAPATTTIIPSARIRKRAPLHRLPRSASQRSRLLPGVPVGSPDSALVRVRGLPWRRRSRRRRWPRPSWRTRRGCRGEEAATQVEEEEGRRWGPGGTSTLPGARRRKPVSWFLGEKRCIFLWVSIHFGSRRRAGICLIFF